MTKAALHDFEYERGACPTVGCGGDLFIHAEIEDYGPNDNGPYATWDKAEQVCPECGQTCPITEAEIVQAWQAKQPDPPTRADFLDHHYN